MVAVFHYAQSLVLLPRARMHEGVKQLVLSICSDLCVPHRKQSLCFFSSFLFNIMIIRYFNTVNTVESGYSRT